MEMTRGCHAGGGIQCRASRCRSSCRQLWPSSTSRPVSRPKNKREFVRVAPTRTMNEAKERRALVQKGEPCSAANEGSRGPRALEIGFGSCPRFHPPTHLAHSLARPSLPPPSPSVPLRSLPLHSTSFLLFFSTSPHFIWPPFDHLPVRLVVSELSTQTPRDLPPLRHSLPLDFPFIPQGFR